MTIIVFLIDTSASMMQKTYLGTTYLDFARLAVEQFLKQRQRDPGYKGDRYMLMTFDEYPMNVKSGWKESQAVFTEQLKNLRAGGLCTFGTAVESVLRFVNLNRMQSGIENYGYGRYPCYSEHVVIISVTDGSGFKNEKGSSCGGFTFSKQTTIGSELTVEPFRWDQRLFSLVLRFSGQQPNLIPDISTESGASMAGPSIISQSNLPLDDSPIEALCSAMGGRSFCIKSHRILSASIDTIVQRIQYNGVTISLQKFGPDPPSLTESSDAKMDGVDCADGVSKSAPTPNSLGDSAENKLNFNGIEAMGDAWKNQSVMLTLKLNKQVQGHWPIPEAFSVESVSSTLPARLAHPVILFRCESTQPMINQEFPFDKYELAHSPLSQYILARKDPTSCWQVFVENSSRGGGIGHPFGYLKTSSTMQSVILFLMPYNYPALLPLLEEAKEPKVSSSSSFRQKMERYLSTVPAYYYSPLKKAFKRINLVVPFLEEFNQPIYSYNVVSLMTKIKHLGKEEFDLACATVAKNLESFPLAFLCGPQFVRVAYCRLTNPRKNALLDCDHRPSLKPHLASIPQVFKDVKICIGEGTNGALSSLIIPSAQFKNPFDIERKSVVSQLEKMRLNFDQQVETNVLHVLQGGMPGQKIKLQHAEDLHNQPISKMGDYQEYMRCLSSIGASPLRELEPQAARPHAFGNPFKLDKKNIAVDEVGEVNTSSSTVVTGNSNNGNGGERGERRTKNSTSISSGGMSGSLSSVPVAIRSKRKPGPIDPNLLTSWKRRRRSSSMSSDFSDTSSISSEVSDISSLGEIVDNNNMEEGDNNSNGDRDYRQSLYSFGADDQEPSPLMIYENGASTSTSAATSSTPTYSFSKSNGVYLGNEYGEGTSKPEKLARSFHGRNLSRQNNEDDNNGTFNGSKITAPPLTASQMCKKQLELSKAVRGVGDRHTVFGRCMTVIQDVINDHERQFLMRFARSEARRFKRSELMKRLDHELKLVPSV